MKAFLFPGQGCQKEGMGKDLYEKFPKAKAIFEEANDILGERFSDTLFSASELLLMDTYSACYLHLRGGIGNGSR